MAKRFAYFKHKEDYDVEIEKRNAIDKDSIVFLEDTNSIANDSEIYEGVVWSKIIDDDMPHVTCRIPQGGAKLINNDDDSFLITQGESQIKIVNGKGPFDTSKPINFYFLDGKIPDYCFRNLSSITDVTLHSIKYIGQEVFLKNNLRVLPDLNGVIEIGASAFANIPEGVIFSLHIPESVDSISKNPWANTNISTITVSEKNSKFNVSGNCLCGSNKNIIVVGNNPTLPDDVRRLEYHSFYNKKLDTLVIPNTTYELAEPFCKCRITNLVIDRTSPPYNYIPYQTFTQCTIENLIITNCSALMGYAFHTCMIKKIEFPENLSVIHEFCFTGSSTEEIICHAKKAPTLYRNNFGNTGVLKVPTGSDYSSWLEQLGSGWTIEYI